MESVKESAANIAASAKSGLDKTKAVVQEKVEKMSAPNPIEKQLATERKIEKIQHAELAKQDAYQQNAAAAHALHTVGGPGPYTYTATGGGQPLGQGTAHSHPIGTATGNERPNTGYDTHVTGGGYSG